MSKQRSRLLETAVERSAQLTRGSARHQGSVAEIARTAIEEYDAIQKPGELEALLKFMAPRLPKYILEIGSGKRLGSLFAISQIAAQHARLISIDLPGGAGGGGYPLRGEYDSASRRVRGQRLRFLRADSHDPHTHRRFAHLLGRHQLDLLLLDGDHSYNGVRQDFEGYGQFVRQGGIIAMHDIVPNPHDATIEVPRFWKEVKAKYRTEDLEGLIDPNPFRCLPADSCGIGIVHYDKAVSEAAFVGP